MPIISRIGRRSFRVRGLYACILLVLTLGSASIIYPLLLMLAGSVRGEGDAYGMEVIPEFLYDDDALYARYVEAKYNTWMEHARAAHRVDVFSWDQFTPPAVLTTRRWRCSGNFGPIPICRCRGGSSATAAPCM